MLEKVDPLPLVSARWLFVAHYTSDTLCPHCLVALKALGLAKRFIPVGKPIDIIFVESGDPRLRFLSNLSKRIGLGDSLPTPLLYYEGQVYFGEMGVFNYVGLIKGLSEKSKVAF